MSFSNSKTLIHGVDQETGQMSVSDYPAEALTPQLHPEQPYQIFDFDYDFRHKVFHTRAPFELVEGLKEYFKSNRGTMQECQTELAGNIPNEYAIDLEHLYEYDEELYNLFTMFLGQATAVCINGEVGSLDIRRAWYNEMESNDYNPLHKHFGMLSFVMYLDIPEEIRSECENEVGNVYSQGLIEFVSGFLGAEGMRKLTFNPRVGDMFMFNSQLHHCVYPFKSDVKRLSLAGNITDIVRADIPTEDDEGLSL